MRFIKKDYVRILEWSFKITYLLLGLATFNVFLYSSPIQPLLVKLCLVLGMLTLLGRLIFFRDYIKTPGWIVLGLFCASFLLSIIVNRSYGQAASDLKWLIWTGMLFFLLYACDSSRSVQAYKKEFTVVAHIIMIYGALSAAAGLIMMKTLYYKAWFTGDGETMFAGFRWERLWGVYTDPNYGGVLSTAAILMCLYFLLEKKGLLKKILYIIMIVLNCGYLVFSDSRTAEVCLIAAVGFWFIYSAVMKKSKIKGVCISLVVMAVFAAAFLGGASYLKSEVSTQVQKQMDIKLKKNAAGKPKQTLNDQQTRHDKSRKQGVKDDFSSGRIALWTGGLEVWKTKPVLGTGYNSFLPFVKDRLPDSYLINNPQGEYVSLHNTYLNILAYQGIVGFVIYAAFMILVLIRWWRGQRFVKAEDRNYIAVLSACVIIAAISMLFLLDGLYTNSPGSFALWTFLGYLMHYTVKEGGSFVQIQENMEKQ